MTSAAHAETGDIGDDTDVGIKLSGLVNALATSGGIAAGRDVHVSIHVEIVVRGADNDDAEPAASARPRARRGRR